jgi:hypothetical protein
MEGCTERRRLNAKRRGRAARPSTFAGLTRVFGVPIFFSIDLHQSQVAKNGME